MGLWEFFTISEKEENKPHKITATLLGGMLFITNALFCLNCAGFEILLLNIPLLFFIFIIELFSNQPHPFRNIAFTLLGIFYIALPFSLLNHIVLSNGTYKPEILIGIFFIIWTNDTFAYLTGSRFGKRKLFERISPKKSWEGSAGGAAFSLLVAFIISKYFEDLSLSNWIIVSIIVIVMGTLGDLVESLYKRSMNIKDSGTILPGHGGILDRFDSLIFSIPFVFIYLIWVN